MDYAQNELRALAKRATRGAGYAWGLAEEAAWASVWMHQRGMNGAAALGALLSAAPAPARCGLTQGVCLMDEPSRLEAGVALSGIVAPALLLPFMAKAAERLGAVGRLAAQGQLWLSDGDALGAQGRAQLDLGPADCQMSLSREPMSPAQPYASRVVTSPESWAVLQKFAHKTYAPATEASRALGAGGADD